jgi:branched-chain amino acid transport system permease protein
MTLVFVRMIAGALAILLNGGFWLFPRHTLTGRAIRAMGQNRDAAVAVGVNVRRLSTVMFGLGIACAGSAGVALAMIFPFSAATGATSTSAW